LFGSWTELRGKGVVARAAEYRLDFGGLDSEIDREFTRDEFSFGVLGFQFSKVTEWGTLEEFPSRRESGRKAFCPTGVLV
jgi:hypothetical protein